MPFEHDSGNTWVNDFGYLTRTETQKKRQQAGKTELKPNRIVTQNPNL